MENVLQVQDFIIFCKRHILKDTKLSLIFKSSGDNSKIIITLSNHEPIMQMECTLQEFSLLTL